MSYYDARIFLDDATEHEVIVRGPFDVNDCGRFYEAFQVEYKPGNPPSFFEFNGMVYEMKEDGDDR